MCFLAKSGGKEEFPHRFLMRIVLHFPAKSSKEENFPSVFDANCSEFPCEEQQGSDFSIGFLCELFSAFPCEERQGRDSTSVFYANCCVFSWGSAKSGKEEKIGVDHFYEAQTKGEISETNVLYLIQNMNVAGKFSERNWRFLPSTGL
jgi:hypothetical protein